MGNRDGGGKERKWVGRVETREVEETDGNTPRGIGPVYL